MQDRSVTPRTDRIIAQSRIPPSLDPLAGSHAIASSACVLTERRRLESTVENSPASRRLWLRETRHGGSGCSAGRTAGRSDAGGRIPADDMPTNRAQQASVRAEERRVGEEVVSTSKQRW